jgi:hypothetical protein
MHDLPDSYCLSYSDLCKGGNRSRLGIKKKGAEGQESRKIIFLMRCFTISDDCNLFLH